MMRLPRLLLIGSIPFFLAACAGLLPPEPDMSRLAEPRKAIDTRLLVTVPLASDLELARLSRVMRWDYDLEVLGHWPLEALGIYCFEFYLSEDQIASELVDRLRADPRVETVQPMQLFEVMAEAYNDPYLKVQNGFHALQAGQAHAWATGKGVKVAVIDSGIDVEHPDLQDRVALVRNFVGTVDERVHAEPHGTAVAGVIGARANNRIGVVGIAPDASLLALRACWHTSGADRGLCNSFTLAQALDFAIIERAQVINLSIQGPHDPLLERLIDTAISKGIAVALAVPEANTQSYLGASLPHLVRVNALAGRYGDREATKRRYPTVGAPGVDIVSTALNGRFDFYSGSSLATAHVSGLLALLLERAPELTPAQINTLLMPDTQGTRRVSAESAIAPVPVNACTALARLLSLIDPQSTTTGSCAR